MNKRPYILAETTLKMLEETDYKVAVLPWGATEPHNYHLPYGTDNFETEAIAATAAMMAWDAGARVLVLPAIPFGVNTAQMDYPGCINMHPSTQARVLEDVVESLDRQGIDRLVIVNGHGGNSFRPLIREVLVSYPDMFISVADWYRIVDNTQFFDEPGDHAGEMETSLMQALAPHLVLPLSEAGDGKERKLIFEAHRTGWAWTPRDWPEVTEDSGVGNPSRATPEKGQKFLEEVCTALAGYLYELSVVNEDDFYE